MIWSAGRAGLGHIISNAGHDSGPLAFADKGVELNPADPFAYHARAVTLMRDGSLIASIKEFERAVSLRPRDYALWIELGRAREQAGDKQGALTAFTEAVRCAPYYAQPRWQLGNFLLKIGQRDAAFAELRRAAGSDPELQPALVSLAWETFGGNTEAIEQSVQPVTPSAHLELARCFVKHGHLNQAVKFFRGAGTAAYWERRKLVEQLLAAKRFTESYQIWASGRDPDSFLSSDKDAITDGGFENEIDPDEPGFGWQLADELPGVSVVIDAEQPRSGTRSLRIDWSGKSNSSTPVASQIVSVEPKTRYRLQFAARSEEVVTGSLPVVSVVDAACPEHLLAQSTPLQLGTSGWQDYKIELTTSNEMRAVRIIVHRQACSSAPCPIFGRVRFDAFSLQKATTKTQ